jgi:hypothetical protein
MQCALCKETIDDDSRYCDQCGVQLMVCSVCGRPGQGKRCIFDGKELVPAGSVSVQPTAVTPTVSPVQPAVPIAQPVQPAPQIVGSACNASGGDKIKLISKIHGIMIEAQDGDIIGRKNGAFAGVFSRFNYISGTHCKIIKTAAGWHIQDMGSTNHTYYNGNPNPLTPNTLYPLSSGTTIKIADVELLVSYDTNEGGTSRL